MPGKEKQPSVVNIAQVNRLVEMVDYQAGAIVSKTLLEKKTGTLTLFAFDQGQGLSEHTAPFDAFVYIIDGESEVTISGKPYRLHTGEAIVMPASEPHALKAIERFKMMLVMIRS
ncbi:MAG: cupin domain-containing protein [Dehalococcoidia bacterium]|nr:cupin domain-containing protein [Dehalococcoidia bacterium]